VRLRSLKALEFEKWERLEPIAAIQKFTPMSAFALVPRKSHRFDDDDDDAVPIRQ